MGIINDPGRSSSGCGGGSLITPHGDYQPRSIRRTSPWFSAHYPSWGLSTRPACCRSTATDTPHYPSWGLSSTQRTVWRHPGARPPSHYPGDRLITPHGDYQHAEHVARVPRFTAHYPSWGLSTRLRGSTGWPRGDRTTHCPSWDINSEIFSRRPKMESPQAHVGSGGSSSMPPQQRRSIEGLKPASRGLQAALLAGRQARRMPQ